jgi:cytochrome P450
MLHSSKLIIGFKIGETPFVMVSGYKKIIELFQNDDGRFSGRFSFDEKDDLMRGGRVAGILHTEDQIWMEQRRFILRVFRDFGLGKNLVNSIFENFQQSTV